jgi:hypothetical protein
MPQWRCAASTRRRRHASHLRSASSSAGAAAVIKLILLYNIIVYYASHQHCRDGDTSKGKAHGGRTNCWTPQLCCGAVMRFDVWKISNHDWGCIR